MSDLPPIVIILQTYARTDYAIRTIQAVKENLQYEGELVWFVVDDGSHEAHVERVLEEVGDVYASKTERIGYGALANWAWKESNEVSPLTLWLEDDWVLKRPFDLTHYAKIMMTHEDIGMIRLAHIPMGLHGWTWGDGERDMYIKLEKDTQYYFSGNPALRHKRFHDAYGDYPTGVNPGETEIAYDWQVRLVQNGPHVLIPVDVGTWGLFGHIGEGKSYDPSA